jgi:hypothetical protein
MEKVILTAFLILLTTPAIATPIFPPPADNPNPPSRTTATAGKSAVQTYKIYYSVEMGGERVLYQRFTGTVEDLNTTLNLLSRQNPSWSFYIE